MKYTASGAARTSVSTWTRATINGGTASWCGTLRREGRTLVRDVDRVATEPDRSQRRLGWPDARGHGHRCAQVAAAAQQPGLELPLCGPHRERVRPVSEQQHLGLLADVRGRQSLPEPERPACAVDGDRRREPRRLEQRRGWRQHQPGDESRDLCGRQLPVLRRLVGPCARATRTQITSTAGSPTERPAGEPHCACDRSSRRGLRQVVRERDPGARAGMHDLERDYPTFDGNYPTRDNSVSTVFDLTPVELVHVPRRSRSEHDPRRRDDGLPDDADRGLRHRLPDQLVLDQGRRRVHDGHGRVRHDDLDGDSRRSRQHGDGARHQPDRQPGQRPDRQLGPRLRAASSPGTRPPRRSRSPARS